MNHHPLRPMPWHAETCDCADCNPRVPSIAEPSLLATILEMAACVVFGVVNVGIIDWLLDGPGLHVMLGMPA